MNTWDLFRVCGVAAAVGSVVAPALGQFDPDNGSWLKDVQANQLRVMTWNVEDDLVSLADKDDPTGSWSALARVVASLQPDVLILQEVGDRTGAGLGSGVDNVSVLTQTIEIFVGGVDTDNDGAGNLGAADPFTGGTVTEWVQRFVDLDPALPAYDLPHIFVSSQTDGFNRNVIVSRYPFVDLNGDGLSRYSDFTIQPGGDLWAVGGNGQIRGYMFAEIDLPDGDFAGDLVIGNSHLNSGGQCFDYVDRVEAARNISYFNHYYYGGGGTATSDPRNAITSPGMGSVLSASTPVIWGGDWNNRPGARVGGCSIDDFGRSPVELMIGGQFLGGGVMDGVDRDGSDATRDSATEFNTGSTGTLGSSKLDYLAWEDSVLPQAPVRQFVFTTSTLSANQYTGPIASYFFPTFVSTFAADHFPVVVDFVLDPAVSAGPPVFSIATASPNPVSALDASVDLSVTVFDPDGSLVGDVEFFFDTNGNGVFNPGVDQLVGGGTPASPGGTSVVDVSVAVSSVLSEADLQAAFGQSVAFFARAEGSAGDVTVEAIDLGVVNLDPVVTNVLASPATVRFDQSLTISADVEDPDFDLASASFYFDSNGNSQVDGSDVLLGVGTIGDASGVSSVETVFDADASFTESEFASLIGIRRVLLEVVDTFGGETVEEIPITLSGDPYFVTFEVTPNPVPAGGSATVSVAAADVDSTLDLLNVVIDNGDGVVDPFGGSDTLLLFALQTGVGSAPLQASQLDASGPNTVLALVRSADGGQTTEPVVVTVEPDCPLEFTGDQTLNFNDLSAFIAVFFNDPQNSRLDIDGNGSINFNDISAYVDAFFGPPLPGC